MNDDSSSNIKKMIDNNEILFWKVYKSIVIRNHIFNVMKSMKLEFNSIKECHIKNRITLNKVRSLGWYLKRNQIELLKDRLLHTNCSDSDSDSYLLIKNSCIEKLMKQCKDDMELIKLIYEKCKVQMNEHDLIYQSSINENYNALELFIKQYPNLINSKPNSFKNAITYGNLSIVKYLYETIDNGRNKFIKELKEKLKKQDFNSYESLIFKRESIVEFLIEIDIFKNEKEPFISLKNYFKLISIPFSKYLFDLNLVLVENFSNLKKINKYFSINNYLDKNTNHFTLFFNKYIKNQIFIGSIEDQFEKLENYSNIKSFIYSKIIYDSNSFQEIELEIENYKQIFEISYFKRLLHSLYNLEIEKKFILLKILIKYDNNNSNYSDDDDGFNKYWWDIEFIPFNLFSINQVIELFEFIKSLYNSSTEQQFYKITIDRLLNVLFNKRDKKGDLELPVYLNSFSNALKLYEIFKFNKLFLNCINEIASNMDTKSMNFIIDLFNNQKESDEEIDQKFAISCLESLESLYESLNKTSESKSTLPTPERKIIDQSRFEFLDTILKIKIYSTHSNNFIFYKYLSKFIETMCALIFDDHIVIKLLYSIKSIFFGNNNEKEFIDILSNLIISNTLLFVSIDFKFIQILYQQFPNCFNYKTSLSILSIYYSLKEKRQQRVQQQQQQQLLLQDQQQQLLEDSNNHLIQILINTIIIPYCKIGDKEIIQVLEILVKLNKFTIFIKCIMNQLEKEIKECKMVSENFKFISSDVASWFLDNYDHLVSINTLGKLKKPFNFQNFKLFLIFCNYLKSKNLEIPKNEQDKISIHYFYSKSFQQMIKEKSIIFFRLYIQLYNDLNIDYKLNEIPLFNELVSNYQLDNQFVISDNEILKLIDIIIKNQNIEFCKEKDENSSSNTPWKRQKFTSDNYNYYYIQQQQKEIFEKYIKENKFFKLVEIGEVKLAIQLYNLNLKSNEPPQQLYKKAYNNFNEKSIEIFNNSKNNSKTYIKPFKQFKSIIKYQELKVFLGLFEMTSMYYGPYVINHIILWSLLYNRIDIYNHFKSLHNENIIKYGEYKFKHGIVLIGFLSKLIHPNSFVPFIVRKDLQMFKFLLNEYLNHNSSPLFTENHKHQLIQALYCYSRPTKRNQSDNSEQISNYLSTTFPQYTDNSILPNFDKNGDFDQNHGENVNDDLDYYEFYDFSISCDYFVFNFGSEEYNYVMEGKKYN